MYNPSNIITITNKWNNKSNVSVIPVEVFRSADQRSLRRLTCASSVLLCSGNIVCVKMFLKFFFSMTVKGKMRRRRKRAIPFRGNVFWVDKKFFPNNTLLQYVKLDAIFSKTFEVFWRKKSGMGQEKGRNGPKSQDKKISKNRWLWLGKKRLSKRKVKIKLTISTMLSEGIFWVGFGTKRERTIPQKQIHLWLVQSTEL